MIASLKSIDAKIKKEEKEERHLARLISNDLDEIKGVIKKTGVMLLSSRL